MTDSQPGTETLRCAYERRNEQGDLAFTVCGEPIRLREDGACAYIFGAGAFLRATCSWPENHPWHETGDDSSYAHDFVPGCEHVSGDRGHEAVAPQEVRA